jgi:hypothetical protein
MSAYLKIRLVVRFVIGFCLFLSVSPGIAGELTAIQPNELSGLKNPKTGCKQYSYQYYPNRSIYYDIQRELYFYRKDDKWKIFAVLPGYLKRQLDDFVIIETDSDKPYLDNEKHVKKFPPDDSRKPKKNMWSKLAFLLLYKHAPQ